ncbi:MAG: hypothetical protein RIS35_1400 [Pseudomonadota bacterium]
MSADDLSPRSAAAPDADGVLLAATLERLGEQDEDIAPAVFLRFIERRPDLASMFRTILPGHPPLGCGNMVFEILCLLKDNADGQPYVGGYLGDLILGHRQFGVDRANDYAEILDTIREVVGARLGSAWPEAERAAWARQTRALQGRIRGLAEAA